jgi:hypothetical protein
MNFLNKKNNAGYLAITTATILALMVMVIAIVLGSANLFTRFDVVDYYNKQTSYAVARSCLNQALLELALNPGYTGNETVAVSSWQCTIQTIVTVGANKVIKARAAINGATTNLQLTVVADTLSTVSLEEVVKF